MALDNVSFKVYRGEAIGIIGHNGAGKSTLLKLLSRVTAPTSGTIYLNGRITSMLEVGTGFHPELTGRENIYMNGAILGMTKAEINRKIDNIIDFSEVRQFIDTPVKRYSSGMYVKLAFSVAAHLDSEILLMDEVLAVGDVKFQEKCLGRMGQASSQEGKTVLYVSHNMRTIRQLCTRCIVLKKGV
ncbi:MAG: ABC transporter ATP-binding protein [Enterocloster bolteae]